MSAALARKLVTHLQEPVSVSFGVLTGFESDLRPFSYLRDDTGSAFVVTIVDDRDDAGGVAARPRELLDLTAGIGE
jgi:hypothetical protein